MTLTSTQGTVTQLLTAIKVLVDANAELTAELGGRFFHGRVKGNPDYPYIMSEHMGTTGVKYFSGKKDTAKQVSVVIQFSCFTVDNDELAEAITQLLWEVIEDSISGISWADEDGLVKKVEKTQDITLEEPDRDDRTNLTVWRSSIFLAFLVQVRR